MFPQGPQPKGIGGSKRIAAVLTAVFLLILLSPLAENWKSSPQDSFPLSYFPMFSHRRGTSLSGNALMGVDRDGNRVVLSYKLAGKGGFNQVRRQIAAKVKDKRSDEICEQVAAKVATSRRRSLREIETVQVVWARHNIDRFFARDDSQVKEKVHASCPVPREASLATVTQEVTQ